MPFAPENLTLPTTESLSMEFTGTRGNNYGWGVDAYPLLPKRSLRLRKENDDILRLYGQIRTQLNPFALSTKVLTGGITHFNFISIEIKTYSSFNVPHYNLLRYYPAKHSVHRLLAEHHA